MEEEICQPIPRTNAHIHNVRVRPVKGSIAAKRARNRANEVKVPGGAIATILNVRVQGLHRVNNFISYLAPGPLVRRSYSLRRE